MSKKMEKKEEKEKEQEGEQEDEKKMKMKTMKKKKNSSVGSSSLLGFPPKRDIRKTCSGDLPAEICDR